MTEEGAGGGLHIDADWKTEAAREKERLIEREQKEPPAAGTDAGHPPATFIELINLLAMQAAIGLGGLKGPGGETIPPNPVTARHHIDLLEVLRQKTEGNLADDEKRTLDAVLYELRQQYIHAVTAPPPVKPDPSKK